jgi:hypothetical protein
MAQVTFGLFDWIDRGKAPLQQLYEERLQQSGSCLGAAGARRRCGESAQTVAKSSFHHSLIQAWLAIRTPSFSRRRLALFGEPLYARE